MAKQEQPITPAEWGRLHGIESHRVYRAIKNGLFTDGITVMPNRMVRLYPATAKREWDLRSDPDKSAANSRPKKAGRPPVDGGKLGPLPQPPPIDPNSLPELKRQKARVELQVAAIRLQQLKGSLLDKSEVFAAQFEAGKQIRMSFENMADRIVDELLAAPNRTAAHSILAREINDRLTQVAAALAKEFSKNGRS